MARPKPQRESSTRNSRSSHRSTLSLSRTEVVINVYDLLPPGRLSSVLWAIGSSLLHSGVVINGKEYAYGGHDRRNTTGVYWTPPKTVPPGGSFKLELLHGFTFATATEIDAIIRTASNEFLGTQYNLLAKNCNHFTSHLCLKLTGRPGPGWLNRAASIGVALPCVVPRDWIEPPDYDNADGELVEDDDDEGYRDHERTNMLGQHSDAHILDQRTGSEREDESSEDDRRRQPSSASKGKTPAGMQRDTSGRVIPAAERAPR